MKFQEAVERFQGFLDTRSPLWIDIDTIDIYAVREAIEVATANLGKTYAYVSPDQLMQVFNAMVNGAANDEPVDEDATLQRLLATDVYVVPPTDDKLDIQAFMLYTYNIPKVVVTFDAKFSLWIAENAVKVKVPTLEDKYMPATVFGKYVEVYGDETKVRAEVLEKHGIRTIEPIDPTQLGGWDIFKRDMEINGKYKAIEANLNNGVILKGILLVGVPGTGKSLAAKIVGAYFGWPVIEFSFSSILSQYVGESEKLLDQFIQIVESIAPVVVYIDEIEKVFHTSVGDPVTPRVIGKILSWMQDTGKDVYVVATANAVFGSTFTAPLPPELMRKGRFDEIYFADIPPFEEKLEIMDVFFKKYNSPVSVEDLDKDKFRRLTKDFTGAELEDAVRKATVDHAVMGGNFVEHLYARLGEIIPIAKIHSRYIYELRKYSIGKFKPVSSQQKAQIFSLIEPTEKPQIRLKESE